MRRGDVRKILGGSALIALLSCPQAWANGNEAQDLVAPYGHFPMAIGSASGPFTTHYLISETTGLTGGIVNVKCFNDQIQRVGPAGGTNIALAPFALQVFDPVSLGLTVDVNYTGFGFCYFAQTGLGDDFAVSFLAGVSEGGNLITTNNSVAIMSDTAQHNVSNQDANIPYWTQEGSWSTFVLLINPTANLFDIDMKLYNTAGTLLGTWIPGGTPALAPRDLDMTTIVDAAPSTAGGFGHADINSSSAINRGYMGWVAGFNFASLQAFMYQIPLDKDDIAFPLGPGDRP